MFDLSELGVDSLMTVDLRKRLELGLGATLSMVDILESHNVEALAERLLARVLELNIESSQTPS